MSASFDGGSDRRIDCTSVAALDNIFVTGGSFMAWVFLVGWGEGGFGRIGNKTEDAPGDNGWAFFVTEIASGFGNASSFTFNHTASIGLNNQITAAAPTNTLSLNTWHHCGVTFNKDAIGNRPVLYHNGVSVTVSELDTPTGTYDSDAASNLIIGARGTGTIDREFNGRIEDVRAYDRILSAAEMQTIYYSEGHDFIVNGLIARWPIMEGSVGSTISGAGTVLDISGNSHHATGLGSPTYGDGIVKLRRKYL